MRSTALLVLLLVAPALARAQEGSSPDAPTTEAPAAEEWQPPPLIEAPKVESAPTAPPPSQTAPTPPPPGYMPGSGNQVPYPYSPYGQATPPEPPGPEIGLMISEVAFGTLTAAASGLLVYFLAVRPIIANPEAIGLPTFVGDLLLVLTFASVPMAVAQTEVNIANGSRYYVSENWPALLSGLGTEAALIGLFYLLRPVNVATAELLLLAGTVIAVPLVEMAVINLTKTPRWQVPVGAYGALVSFDEQRGLTGGIPVPQLVPVSTSRGFEVGVGLSLAAGRF